MSPARSRRQKKQSFFEHATRIKEPMHSQRPKKSSYVILVVVTTLVIGFLTFYVSSSQTAVSNPMSLIDIQRAHQLQPLPTRELLVVQQEININRLWNTLTSILIERPPGSENIVKVKDRISTILRNLPGWQVDYDTFYDFAPQPYGRIKFTNIIASTNPQASRKLILACHYDSKIFPGQTFLGATDSAVPCAIMLEIANVLNALLQDHHRRQRLNPSDQLDVALELIFFDGEEAFVQWSATDSIYGARHLARKWKRKNILKKIDLFILLDLIGHAETQFSNFQVTNTTWYKKIVEVETNLSRRGFLPQRYQQIFRPDPNPLSGHRIEDDHIPFLREGVPIMHLISVPFPRVWHTIADNESALDRIRIKLVTQILTDFVAQYLHLRIPPK